MFSSKALSLSRVFLMDRAGSDLEGVKKSLIKARPEGQVVLGDGLLVTSVMTRCQI